MKIDTFFEKFDQFIEAPNALMKLRELIVHLAVRGELVPHNPEEEPVNLFMRGSSLSDSIPSNWRSGVLGDAITLEYGENLPAAKRAESGEYPVYGSNGIVGTHDSFLTKKPAIIIGRKGCAGALNIANGPSWTTDVAYFVQPPSDLDLRFTYYLLSSLKLKALAKGIKPGLSRKEVYRLPIRLPPLAEQKRIVAKADDITALCNRLEAQLHERNTREVEIARASLGRFTDTPTPDNLHLFFNPSYTSRATDLRKSILTLAVQGKLVRQDSHDESANELLGRIAADRDRLPKDQAARLPKNVPPLTDEDMPYNIPESWRWARIGDLAILIDCGTPQKPDSNSSNIPVYRMSNIAGGRLIDKNLKYVNAAIDDLPRRYLKANDILFERTTSYESVGKVAIFKGSDDTATFESSLIRIRLPVAHLFPPFFNLAMTSPYFRQTQIEPAITQQCGQANFNGTKLASTVVPVPPLTEQRRIVAKVDQLLALVDLLEAQLVASRATVAKLMEAVVDELITRD